MGSSVSKSAYKKTTEITRRSHARHQNDLNEAGLPPPPGNRDPRTLVPGNGDKFAQRVYAQRNQGVGEAAAPAPAAGGKEAVILVSGGEGRKGRKVEVDRARGIVIRHKRVKR
ncbi:hypothetical protein B5807_05848 [Epicoccum nigrum]|uniref:Uncharacterized protein n=1 Tax=Epicoccum nigrum TaxID=105696 RepID=A0A1Y2M0T2_EPING|nr:hypothetical protein B5807_05848 [Epicoccum nigrum]